ncbi:cation-translocating P-type ATPase [Enterococcus pallens]|uniref:Calcium-translocating P-type ATPase, PMCA-type n=2 Tax=Enterococcus pallens TaxID=160454 RepID=R2SYZ1_9ENTE|nr:cation-translocating P-type ATPase [Enterococcus pallens]EOH97946.1 calcium-translocating P-type ATPase, PMCA-type [Enterococcus pallens ATCC BAA-351]EOU20635.1 calcium-translocating P-type ATPase, PMCA-type [Enterococcus pallens ATCC BAA-351]
MMKMNWEGLTTDQVNKQLAEYGKNQLEQKQKEPFYLKVFHIILEPMFLLLVVAALIYFFLGEPKDGLIMLTFVAVIIAIEVVQEWKTDQTLNALKDLSAPKVKVIRNKQTVEILSEDLVPGDVMLIEEGVKIPADGFVMKANDLRVNESSLTGEAEAVWKKLALTEENTGKDYWRDDYVYTGTLVTTGSATILVDKTGTQTEYGKIGKHLATVENMPSPLDKQIGKLVKVCATIAFIFLLLVAVVTFFNDRNLAFGDRIIQSILSGITIAMAMIPEEFPVVLTIFLSMGAWRLAKKQSLIRKLPAVETMGSVSVLAVDKTGTITENKMTVSDSWIKDQASQQRFTEIVGLACETEPYDPMEIAILEYAAEHNWDKEALFSNELITEYPFTDELKMMGHVWQRSGKPTIAVKGSPESVLAISTLSPEDKRVITHEIKQFAKRGLRVLVVGEQVVAEKSEIPASIEECSLTFLGLVGLSDPPRLGVKNDILQCRKAGIKVVMITGDNGITASAIAKQVGIANADYAMTGNEIDQLTEVELAEKVKGVNVFSRVTPEHKMKIVKAIKQNDEVVAMTGDGVNDAPALKYADIGIAMGKRGSEVSREAADLILMDDNFSTIVNTIKDGRRIYDNIKKAIGYIFVIHIPIALTALFGPLLGIAQSALFLLPTHVVLLELVIDPTCSVVLERQPSEPDIMNRPPRSRYENILSSKLLLKSVVQGLIIFAASFGAYYLSLQQAPTNDELARTMGLTVLIVANIFLVMVNSSNHLLGIQTFVQLRRDKVIWGILGGTIVALLGLIYSPINGFLDLAALSMSQLASCALLGMAAVCWYDVVKLVKNKMEKNSQLAMENKQI